MLSFQRFYSFAALIIFIVIIILFYFPNNSPQPQFIKLSKNSEARISDFLSKRISYSSTDPIQIYRLKLPQDVKQKRNVLEIDEVNIHEVAIFYRLNGKLETKDWLKCEPDENLSLNSNPYFIFENKIPTTILMVSTGASYTNIPIKLYDFNNFFKKKNNQEMVKIINIIVLFSFLIVSVFVYFRLRSVFSLFYIYYAILSLGTSLLYNGFLNNFWLVNQAYFADHSVGLMLSLHILSMSVFLLHLIKRSQIYKFYLWISYILIVISAAFFITCFFLNSYYTIKYLIFLCLVVCLVFLFLYPKIFTQYQTKYAYWLNYLSILLFTTLFSILTLKYTNIIIPDFFIHVVVKTLFVGHIICLFTAFILMNKNKLLTSYLYNNLLLNENDKEIVDRNPELLASLTEREYTVLELIAKGFKDQEIAEQLFVSVSTVKSHKQKIYKKLEISNKSQATQIYFNFNIKAMDFLNN
ncbi:LuxR C-terminal-related transcriptional regulator [Pedobacter cryophilus]|uniref:HTH luxR-type domain-containing protein n=1 Tax=Pedobacter cryophilus TaxID=2571271 RepID=A0A4U1BYX7_9SPHI|nr:LuxR C-terminal-related transcriptional regulator [Pedobacter cryophilus]TKB97711.1 hypothetical protein FA046_10125 [Pedobacter cryophilus]